MRVPSWRRRVTCCASSSQGRSWECRSSDCERAKNIAERGPKHRTMNQTIWIGAVAYDPKVVTIWEGMRRYFHEEAHLPVEVVLFQSYETQVSALLAEPGAP